MMNNSAIIPALPAVTHSSGYFSDVYSPKLAFIIGTAFFGAISLGRSFLNDLIVLVVLRALQRIGASLAIPSTLNLSVQLFPDPSEQARAICLFGGTVAVGNDTKVSQLDLAGVSTSAGSPFRGEQRRTLARVVVLSELYRPLCAQADSRVLLDLDLRLLLPALEDYLCCLPLGIFGGFFVINGASHTARST
ncbi:hypothetical protein BDV93DRAFT_579879 [Ceratobasidium sp. AG-I]|nr:hypothetical protein BDV93DRAFT_579879 [Ceratobasidium sp. AG-I]